MKKILHSDFIIGLALTLVTLGAFFLHVDLFESLELKTYDLRSHLRQTFKPADEIAIVAIDDDSIAKLGRWPWPRSFIAGGIDAITEAEAKVIGLNILFTEPERNEGLTELRTLKEDIPPLFTAKQVLIKDKLIEMLSEAEVRLDNDTQLTDALLESKNVVLPMYFALGPSLGDEEPVLSSHTILQIDNPDAISQYPIVEGHSPAIPLDIFAEQAPAIGHVNTVPDSDGVVRSELPLLQFQGDYYPSFSLQMIRMFLNIPMEEISLKLGESVTVGRARIPIDANGRMLINFNGPVGTFPYYSFYDVINEKIDQAALKNKIVLVGHMATGIADLNNTPIGGNFPGIEIVANVIQNILHQNFITRPQWAHNAELGLLIFVGLFISLALPRLRALAGTLISLVLFLGIAGAGTYFFVASGYWLKIFLPLILLLTGYLIITSKRFLMTEKKKELVEASAI